MGRNMSGFGRCSPENKIRGKIVIFFWHIFDLHVIIPVISYSYIVRHMCFVGNLHKENTIIPLLLFLDVEKKYNFNQICLAYPEI